MADIKVYTAAAVQATLNYGRLAVAAGKLYFGDGSNNPVAVANESHVHAASAITQSASYRFVTDTEKTTWNAKEPAITKGTTAQYFRGDMSLAAFPTALPASDVYAWAKAATQPMPLSHASTATTYGVGSTTAFGHLKVGEGITVSSGVISLSNHGSAATISTTPTTLSVSSHKNRTILVSAAVTITVPTNAAAAFPIGTHIDFIQTGTGTVTFSPSSGVTLSSEGNKRIINAQYQAVTLIKTATDTWYLIGALK